MCVAFSIVVADDKNAADVRSVAWASPSVAATTTATDPVASASCFLAGIDVIGEARVHRVGIELHFGAGEDTFFPWLGWLHRRATRQQRNDNEGKARAGPTRQVRRRRRRSHHRAASND